MPPQMNTQDQLAQTGSPALTSPMVGTPPSPPPAMPAEASPYSSQVLTPPPMPGVIGNPQTQSYSEGGTVTPRRRPGLIAAHISKDELQSMIDAQGGAEYDRHDGRPVFKKLSRFLENPHLARSIREKFAMGGGMSAIPSVMQRMQMARGGSVRQGYDIGGAIANPLAGAGNMAMNAPTNVGNSANFVTNAIAHPFNTARNAINAVGNTVSNNVNSAANAIAHPINTVTNAANAIGNNFSSAANAIAHPVDTINNAANSVGNAFGTTGNNIANAATNFGNNTVNAAKDIGNAAMHPIDTISNTASDAANSVGNAFSSAGKGIGNAFSSLFAEGGHAEPREEHGRGRDTQLVYITPYLRKFLDSTGKGSINPHDGHPEYFGLDDVWNGVKSAGSAVGNAAQYLGSNAWKGIKAAAPTMGRIAAQAAPLVGSAIGTAVGGPGFGTVVGGFGGQLASQGINSLVDNYGGESYLHPEVEKALGNAVGNAALSHSTGKNTMSQSAGYGLESLGNDLGFAPVADVGKGMQSGQGFVQAGKGVVNKLLGPSNVEALGGAPAGDPPLAVAPGATRRPAYPGAPVSAAEGGHMVNHYAPGGVVPPRVPNLGSMINAPMVAGSMYNPATDTRSGNINPNPQADITSVAQQGMPDPMTKPRSNGIPNGYNFSSPGSGMAIYNGKMAGGGAVKGITGPMMGTNSNRAAMEKKYLSNIYGGSNAGRRAY